MACVWKHPKSKFWFARYKDKSGKWVNRTTGQTSQRKAMAMARGWEEASKLDAEGRLTRDRARQVVDEIMRSSGIEVPTPKTVKGMLDDWTASIATDREQTANRYRTVAKQFLAFLCKRATAPLESITTAEIRRYIKSREETNAKKTAANDLRCLSAAFNQAVKDGDIDRNPCWGVEKPSGKGLKRKPFSPEQVRMLFAAAPSDEWRGLIAVCWYTGLRIGDASRLDWREVDLAQGIITRVQNKTDSEVTIPIHSALRSILEGLAGDVGGFVFPSLATESIGGKRGLSARFIDIIRAAGIDEERQETKSGRTLARFSAHSLRHGSISALANASVPAEVRRKISGHADDRSHDEYSHHEIKTLRDAVERIPDIR